MTPIQELLHRIRWDRSFGSGRFSVGYYDRVAKQVVTVPMERIELAPGRHFSFVARQPDGTVHEVPFHRVREVHRDGNLIWHREVSGEAAHGQSDGYRER